MDDDFEQNLNTLPIRYQLEDKIYSLDLTLEELDELRWDLEKVFCVLTYDVLNTPFDDEKRIERLNNKRKLAHGMLNKVFLKLGLDPLHPFNPKKQ